MNQPRTVRLTRADAESIGQLIRFCRELASIVRDANLAELDQITAAINQAQAFLERNEDMIEPDNGPV